MIGGSTQPWHRRTANPGETVPVLRMVKPERTWLSLHEISAMVVYVPVGPRNTKSASR